MGLEGVLVGVPAKTSWAVLSATVWPMSKVMASRGHVTMASNLSGMVRLSRCSRVAELRKSGTVLIGSFGPDFTQAAKWCKQVGTNHGHNSLRQPRN